MSDGFNFISLYEEDGFIVFTASVWEVNREKWPFILFDIERERRSLSPLRLFVSHLDRRGDPYLSDEPTRQV